MGIYDDEVIKPISDAREGKVKTLSLHLERVNEAFALRKSIYTLIGGNTGSGKTSFVDDALVLRPYHTWQYYKDQTDVTFRVLYRSMERRRSLKLTKWACWKLYHDAGILVDSETLLGYKQNRISDDLWNRVLGAREWAEELLDYVEIVDGRTTPTQYWNWIQSHALTKGRLFKTDQFRCWEVTDPGVTVDSFGSKFQTLKNGERIPIISFKLGNKEYIMKQDSSLYITTKPDELTLIVGDHLGKFQGEAGLGSRKAVVDKASEHNADARDIFEFSPVAVSQFNRAIGDVQRMKFADGDLKPQLEDFKESGSSQEDADLVLALFNPFRYKSMDDDGMYKGYNLNRMINPYGHNRFRLLSILKNSYGVDDRDYGLKFLGEANLFMTLPKPSDTGTTPELEVIYNDIKLGK